MSFEVERAAGRAKPDCFPKVAAETSQGLHFPSLPQSTSKVIINDATKYLFQQDRSSLARLTDQGMLGVLTDEGEGQQVPPQKIMQYQIHLNP